MITLSPLPPMRIHYTLKRLDYLRFALIHQMSMRSIHVLHLGLALLVYFSQKQEAGPFVAMIMGILAYLCAWVVQLTFAILSVCLGSHRTVLTEHVLEVQDDSLYEETAFNRSFYKWTGIVKMISRPGFVALYVHGNAAHVIPNRAFSNAEQRRNFINQVRAKLAAA